MAQEFRLSTSNSSSAPSPNRVVIRWARTKNRRVSGVRFTPGTSPRCAAPKTGIGAEWNGSRNIDHAGSIDPLGQKVSPFFPLSPAPSPPPSPSPSQSAAGGLKIGEVAERSGLPVKTIRYYSDEGLIRPIGRSEGRYRLFSSSVFEELALIRSLKAMEIPLAEVGQILEVRRTGTCSCSALKGTIRSKREEIQRRIQELEGLQRELSQLLDSWQECGRAPN